jgi:hypothetical protein
VLALLPYDMGCAGREPRGADVVISSPTTDATAARSARRRRRTRVRSAQAAVSPRSSSAARSSAGATTLSLATSTGPSVPVEVSEPDEPDRPRPRITESGPMLPEDLGPPPQQSMDFTSGGAGPVGLSERDVSRALEPLLTRLGSCAAATTDDDGRGPHGRVSIRMRVRNDGRPLAARVTGGGGPRDFVHCVRRVVASARFPAFRGADEIIGWGFDVD